MSYARARQRSRQMDERLIERIHKDFSYGMARQADIEGTDLPKNAAADGVNVRFHKIGYEGRQGSLLYTPADFGVTITDNTETLATAMQTGELYTANGSVIPSTGDIFIVYGTGDFTGDDLATAKGSAVRRLDCFYIVNSASGSESVRWIGRLGVPAIPGYGDTSTTEFSITRVSGDKTVTATGNTFSDTHVGSYINWNDNTRSLIKTFNSTTSVEIEDTPTANSTTTMCYLQPPINATCYHEGINKIVALFGDRLYVSKNMPLAGWDEIPPIGFVPSIRPGNSSSGIILPDGDDAILINQKALYRISLTSTPYYYKLNSLQPVTKIIDTDKSATSKYKYNYTYGYARLTGNTIFKDRTNTADGVLLEHESPTVKPSTGTRDWGYKWAAKPVGDASKTQGVLTGGTLQGAYVSQSGWNEIDDAEFTMSVTGTTYTIGVDLTGIVDMNDLCNRLQYAARTHYALREVTFEFVTDHIVVKTAEDDTISYCGTVSGGTGTDISGSLELDSGSATIETTAATIATTATIAIQTLTMPKDSDGNYLAEWYHATHYPVYRTSNCADLDEGTEAHDYRWTNDIPVAKAFTGSVAVGVLTVTKGTLEAEDVSATIVAENGRSGILTSVTSSTTAVVVGVGITTLSSQSLAIGGGTVFTASQTGTAITVASGKTLTSSDEGKQIFWADGYVSIIKSVTNGTTAVAVASAEHVSQGATCDPTSRTFTDTISDDNIEQEYARYAGWPLRIRYQEPMSAGDIGAIVPGYVFVAVQGTSEFQYCTRLYKWHVGYYSPAFQHYDRVADGVQMFKVKDTSLVIMGSTRKYLVDTTLGSAVGEERIGESVTRLNDPQVVSNAFGALPSSGVQETESGAALLVTNEPAVRAVSTTNDSENFAEKRILRSDIQKMKNVFIGAYNAVCGYFLWGKQEI